MVTVMVQHLGLNRSPPYYLSGNSGTVYAPRTLMGKTFSRPALTSLAHYREITVWYYYATSGVGVGVVGSGSSRGRPCHMPIT